MSHNKLNHKRKAQIKKDIQKRFTDEVHERSHRFIVENGGGKKGIKALVDFYEQGGDL